MILYLDQKMQKDSLKEKVAGEVEEVVVEMMRMLDLIQAVKDLMIFMKVPIIKRLNRSQFLFHKEQ